MRKLFSFLLLLLILLIGTSLSTPTLHADTFQDVPDDYWAAPQIHHLHSLGLINGYPDGTFKPDGVVTRSEMTALLLRTNGHQQPELQEQPPFVDIPSTHWGRYWINTAYVYGMISGYPQGKFQPDRQITRAEAATMLSRIFELDPNTEQNAAPTLQDVPKDHWAYKPLQALVNLDIIKLDRTNKVYPDQHITRAEQAYWIAELLAKQEKQVTLSQPDTYTINLNTWMIANDGTKSVQTTQGINRALQWASRNGFHVTTLPAGTYLIDKDHYIDMVANMTFRLNDDTIIQKEANGYESYITLRIGYGADHVVIEGGHYRGDRETHDYSEKDPYGPGTHEGGYGIYTAGAKDVTIKGVKSTHFTGDGLAISAHGTMIQDLYPNSFTSGAISQEGELIEDNGKIRTAKPIPLTHDIFKTEHEFELTNLQHLTQTFDLYFYSAEGQYLDVRTQVQVRELIEIPQGAASFHLVFSQPYAEHAYAEVWNRAVSQQITVQDSEFAFNRRQGITVAGADRVLIENNVIHDTEGTAPQSGIDLEGGFGENGNRNSNVHIRSNHFYNNASYDIILYDGRDAIIEDNHLASKNVIGLAISEPFRGAIVKNNHFDGSRIFAYQDAVFLNNRMNDSFTNLHGPNLVIDGLTMTDSMLSISSAESYGVAVSNVTIEQNEKSDYALSLWSQPIQMENITIKGKSNIRTLQGGIEEGSTFENLTLLDYDGADLPRGTYRECRFETADDAGQGIVINDPGQYVFENCDFSGNQTAILIEHKEANVTIRNSRFDITGDHPAISIQQAANVHIENSEFQALERTQAEPPIIKVSDYWNREQTSNVMALTVEESIFVAPEHPDVIAISTIHAGQSAPSYTIKGNNLNQTQLQLKENDQAMENEEI